MNLFSFFKKNEKTGRESAVDSTEIMGSVKQSKGTAKINTALSYHPSWRVPQEQEYVFRFLANELEPLKPNQISLSGINIEEDPANKGWLVKAFFRSSLDQVIEVGEVELLLLDAEGNTVASQQFDLKELGNIPARSARPWIFVFKKVNILADEIPGEGWTLAFNVQSMVPHRLELAESWEESLPKEQKEALKKIVEDLPKLKPREVNINGFQVQQQEDGGIAASVFIRNGHSKEVNIEQLPLEVIDASGDLVARGTFKLEGFSVKANTTKPWTFIFPKSLVQKENPDFSRWVAKVVQ